jgi:hypothetical protein
MGEGINYPNLDFPAVIDITLYKNNYYDNLLITKLKRDTAYEEQQGVKDTYLIGADDFREVLYTSFMKEIEAVRSLPLSDLQKNATSLYFLDKILTSYNSLRFLKVNVSREENFSRLNKTEKVPVIFFNYKISMLNIRLPEIFTTKQVRTINKFFIENSIAVYDEFYGYDHRIYFRTSELLSFLLSSEEKDGAADLLLSIIDNKSELDNPLIMLATDFEI